MPPLSYIIGGAVLALFVFLSLALTGGFAVIFLYWPIFFAGAVMAGLGGFRIAKAVDAPEWTGVALISPAVVWSIGKIAGLRLMTPVLYMTSSVLLSLSLIAAGAAALRLVEHSRGSHPAFKAGYAVLAAAAVLNCFHLAGYVLGMDLVVSPGYVLLIRIIAAPVMLVQYAAFAAAAITVAEKYRVERWTVAVICLICIVKALQALNSIMFAFSRYTEMFFWFEPLVLLVGGLAVWRMSTNVMSAAANRQRLG